MGDFGRPQMFSPIRRSSLYLALWRLDMLHSSSPRAGVSEDGGAISTAAFASTRHKSASARLPGGEEGAVYAHPPLRSQVLAVRATSASAVSCACAHQS